LSGVVIGLLVMLLAMSGNSANMAICVACFIRDAAGALKLHTAAPVQYFRPEIVGFVCGSFLISMAAKEYRSTASSAPMVRFLRGAVMMIGALVFLGCPLRQLILAGQGSSDSAVTFLGMLLGAAFAHNFNLVGSAAKAATATDAAVPGGPAMPGKIAVIVCIVLLFVIAATNLRRKKAAK